METTGLRELRQHASDLVRRAEAGEEFVVTVSGRPAARLVGISKRTWCSAAELAAVFAAPAWGDSTDVRGFLDQDLRDPWAAAE